MRQTTNNKQQTTNNEQLPEYRAFHIFQWMAGLGSLTNLEFGNNSSPELMKDSIVQAYNKKKSVENSFQGSDLFPLN